MVPYSAYAACLLLKHAISQSYRRVGLITRKALVIDKSGGPYTASNNHL